METARTRTRKRRQRQARRAQVGGVERPFIWREALWGLDWLSLRLSPVYLGLGVPRGDGGPVVLVPGFMTTDAYLVEMYFWLRRIGYDPHLSGIGMNANCVQTLAQRLEETVVAVNKDTGRPVRIIGHSLGGFLARRVALGRPEMVSHLISLGSPIKSLEAHPALMATAKWVTGHVRHLRSAGGLALEDHGAEGCECLADHCVPTPPSSIRRAALYSRVDGVIDWRNCLEADPSLNHEVGGTHIGLVFNPRAYRVVANVLAKVEADDHPGTAGRPAAKAA